MKYFIKKIITLIITLLFISLLTFTAFSVIPGDAAISKLGVDASPEAIARAVSYTHLDVYKRQVRGRCRFHCPDDL